MIKHWRVILARAPLPMLALAASWGVYEFSALFVPQAVAVIQAAAFECTYVGLAVSQGFDVKQRKRATLISIGAVMASIIYNSLAGWFTRQPQLLVNTTAIADLMLAILHGLPLAWVAYLVADLLLHSSPAQDPQPTSNHAEEVVYLKDHQGLSFTDIGRQLGISRQAAAQRYSKALAQSNGHIVEEVAP